MNKVLRTVIVVVVALVALGGGAWFYFNQVKPASAFTNAAEVMKEFKSADFEMKVDMLMEMAFDGTTMETGIKIDGTGSVDVDSEKLQMDMDMIIDMFGTATEVSISEIVDGSDFYIKEEGGVYELVSLEELGQASGMNLEEFAENQMWTDYVGMDTEYVYEGVDEIDDESVYEYSVIFDEEQYSDLVAGIVDDMSTGGETAVEMDFSNTDISYTIWVSVSSGDPVRERMVVDGLAAVITTEGVDVDVRYKALITEMTYSNVNGVVEIEVPSL